MLRTRVVASDVRVASGERMVRADAPVASKASAQAVASDDASLALRQLLRIELDIRNCKSADELFVLLVNDVPKVTGARQAYVFDISPHRPQLVSAGSLIAIDRQSPTIRWLETVIARVPSKQTAQIVSLSDPSDDEHSEGRAFPFVSGHWLPLIHANARCTHGVLLAAEKPFESGQVTLASRLISTAAHAASVLQHRAPRAGWRLRRVLLAGVAVLLPLILAWPIPMTALAPMEVVAQDPYVIAAPIDGVIDDIAVAPNTAVRAGDPIVRYVDTIPRNQMLIAERELGLAEAKLRQVQQAAFSDEKAKRDLAQVRAELALKQSELELARDTFEKTQVRAPRDGVVVYGDRKDWVGRPVSTGQRILEIADTSKVEIRAFMPAADILELKSGARVRAFLDGNPLHPVEASVVAVSHVARPAEGQGLAYRVQARLAPDALKPRLGVRGTAQLFSDKAALGYYLFRRPISWLRQKVGL